jgi:VanZ family protein
MINIVNAIKIHWIALTLVVLVAITLLSLWPLDQLPTVPGTDKTHHLVAYALLMLPTGLRKPDGWIVLGLLFICYSGAIELLQPYVNRYGEWTDMLANTTGVICGAVTAGLLESFTRSKEDFSR